MQAKISEIFLSYQGEGPYLGSRQLFVRVFGCNLKCAYCDTASESYKSFSKEALLGKVLDFDDNYNELTLTGGEPLLYGSFLSEFLSLYKRHLFRDIYLETNGILAKELSKVIDYVDIVAMDFKLPSSTGIADNLWPMHKEFLKIASKKQVIVKAVIADSTTIDDIKDMSSVLNGNDKDFMVVLQPVTPYNNIKAPDEEMISLFKKYIIKSTGKETLILGQGHKCFGIR